MAGITSKGRSLQKSRQGIRAIPIPAVLPDYLVEPRMRGGEGRVFASDRQVRSRAEAAAKLWRTRALSPLTLHEARHTYGT